MAAKKKKKFKWKTTTVTIVTVFFLFTFHKEVIRYGYKLWRVAVHIRYHSAIKKGIIDYPFGYSVHGIDVSRWQDEIDWTNICSKTITGDTLSYQFAFIKATEGIWIEDPMFRDNWKNASEFKIIRGAYHYFIPGTSAKLQASNYISSVKLSKGDLPPVVDIEETRGKGRKYISGQLKIFVDEIERHYKVRPIIYSNISFIRDNLSDFYPGYKFWVAHYYKEELQVDKNINWLFWQHNDRAGLIGCDNNVDVNVFNGNLTELRKILVK
jgi:lysozyme